MWADVVAFDPLTIADRSTLSSPNELAVGMHWVLLLGRQPSGGTGCGENSI